MKYALILKNGKIKTFYILAVAELYQSINGGVLLDCSNKIDEKNSLLSPEYDV